MKPLDFIAAVVPSAGFLCVAEFSSRKKQHAFAKNVEELAPTIQKFNAEKKDTYFALASFSTEGSRESANALFMRSVFMDLDCGEGKAYPNKQAAAEDLDRFLQETSLGLLGNPWIVSSGGGLHVYWPFKGDIPVTEWRVTAENVKRLCKKHSLHIDFTVTADAARVLRVPDTVNWKNKSKPRKVKILVVGGYFDFDAFTVAVKTPLNGQVFNPPPTPAPAIDSVLGPRPEHAKHDRSSPRPKVFANTISVFKNILVKTQAGTGCGQLKHYIDNAQKDGMEPLWRGLLSIAQKCVDGDKAARFISKMHPYSLERMQTKLSEIKGPYPCIKFDTENLGICPSCSHWGKIVNPLALAYEVETDNSAKTVVIEPVAGGTQSPAPQIVLTRPTPPKGFSYGKNGGVYKEISTEDEEGAKLTKQVLVLPYDLFVVNLLNVAGDHYVYMLAMRPEGAVKVTFQQKAVVSKDETVKALAAQNIVAAFGSGNDKNLFDYVRGCVEAVSANAQAINVPISYGWQEDGAFVAGGKIFKTDGSVSQIPMPGLENITKATTPSGTLDNWRKIPEMLIAKGEYEILALGCGVGFGSPLMEFSGLDGFTIHAGSTESGTGKSLALSLCASVWGHPRDYRVNTKTSDVAMQQRAGLLRNIPLTSDEITNKNRKDFEWFPEFVFDIAEGRGKERMESGANKERVNLSTWALLVFMSSNSHAVDYMTGARKHSSEGELRRMLEWTPNKALSWEAHEIDVIKSLRLNYATAGDVYAQWLVANRRTALALYQQVYDKIKTEFAMTNDERYWHAGASAVITGCVLAGRKYAGIIDLPIREITNVYKKLIEKARHTVRTSVRTAEDVLNSYIRDFYGRFINVRVLDGKTLATFGDASVIDESITRTQVAGRVERNVTPGFVNFYIEAQALKAYCSSMSFAYADFCGQLEKLYRVEHVKKDMLSKTKGPQMRVNALRISRPESDLVENEEKGAEDILSVG